jgi:thiol-disulfide isomerase/thioredoxin
MVDWDRVDELRSNGESWTEIAADPKVGFHPEASAGDPGRALRALYHRQKARRARQGPAPAPKKRPAKELEKRWTLLRVGYLAVPLVAVWFALAYVAPSPVGLLVPAIPYLGLALAAVAFLLIYALWRTRERRWTPILRSAVVGGVVLGLVFAGLVGLVGALVFGCPYLPPASAVGSEPGGWHGGGGLPNWQSDGKPVVYFFGATWCPYCSASSWAVLKALTEYGSVSGVSTSYSSNTDVYPATPEAVLSNVQQTGSPVAFQVSEYTGSVDGQAPATSSCYQLAYVTAYSGGSIPFLVIGGKYVHGGTSLVDPANLTNWNYASDHSGAPTVKADVLGETGQPWFVVQDQAWWVMGYIARCLGVDSASGVTALGNTYGWSAADKAAVGANITQIS